MCIHTMLHCSAFTLYCTVLPWLALHSTVHIALFDYIYPSSCKALLEKLNLSVPTEDVSLVNIQ